jgi:hypothetical protein
MAEDPLYKAEKLTREFAYKIDDLLIDSKLISEFKEIVEFLKTEYMTEAEKRIEEIHKLGAERASELHKALPLINIISEKSYKELRDCHRKHATDCELFEPDLYKNLVQLNKIVEYVTGARCIDPRMISEKPTRVVSFPMYLNFFSMCLHRIADYLSTYEMVEV